jgi:hypothetical protein
MYACSPGWSSDWISESQLKTFLGLLAPGILPSPLGPRSIGVNHGVHFTGGEPFLNFPLLLEAVKAARDLSIPSVFAETNCFWCKSDPDTKALLNQLRENGMCGILISVNPFILEYVPFERTERAVRLSAEVFGRNALVYQQVFYNQFRALRIKGTLPFEKYLNMTSPKSLSHAEILPMGRLPYRHAGLYDRHPARDLFQASCAEELTCNWHIHIDNYSSYVPGYCGGISLGDAGELDDLCKGFETEGQKVIRALAHGLGELWDLGRSFGYCELAQGYISKCHLCVDIRRHLVSVTEEFKELAPREFYSQL